LESGPKTQKVRPRKQFRSGLACKKGLENNSLKLKTKRTRKWKPGLIQPRWDSRSQQKLGPQNSAPTWANFGPKRWQLSVSIGWLPTLLSGSKPVSWFRPLLRTLAKSHFTWLTREHERAEAGETMARRMLSSAVVPSPFTGKRLLWDRARRRRTALRRWPKLDCGSTKRRWVSAIGDKAAAARRSSSRPMMPTATVDPTVAATMRDLAWSLPKPAHRWPLPELWQCGGGDEPFPSWCLTELYPVVAREVSLKPYA
jgi:hypothetical protein